MEMIAFGLGINVKRNYVRMLHLLMSLISSVHIYLAIVSQMDKDAPQIMDAHQL